MKTYTPGHRGRKPRRSRLKKKLRDYYRRTLFRGLVGAWYPSIQRVGRNYVYDWSGNGNHGVIIGFDEG